MPDQTDEKLTELMAAQPEDPGWMMLMHKMLDVMWLYGHRPEPARPEEPKPQEPEINDTELAKAYLLNYLSSGPKQESLVWLDAAKVEPQLTVRSIFEAVDELKIQGCDLKEKGLYPIRAWRLGNE